MSVYLDHNATTPLRPEAAEAMRPWLEGRFGNPASIHEQGQLAATDLDRARRRVAALIGGDPHGITFTSSGTEAVMTAVLGTARARADAGRHVVTSAVEHAAGEDAAQALEAEGFAVTRVAPGSDGWVDPGVMIAAFRDDTVLVSLMHANNETGVIQPAAEVGAACRARGISFHTDAVQSAGKIPVSVTGLSADLLSLAAHKFGGPPGAGALWVRSGVRGRPLLPGRQEGGRRGGTVNVPAAVGMGAAAEAVAGSLEREGARMGALRDRLEAGLARRLPELAPTGGDAHRLPNTVHVILPSGAGEDVVPALDLAGFSVSAGSACTSGSAEPSRVLLAMGIDAAAARRALRISVGPGTRDDDVDAFLDALAGVIGVSA